MLYLDYIISKRNAATVSVIRFSNVWVVRTLVRWTELRWHFCWWARYKSLKCV